MTTMTHRPSKTADIRKIVHYQEEILLENGQAPAASIVRVTVAAVVSNPWAGTGPDTDLSTLTEQLAPQLARVLTDRLLESLGGAEQVEAFGKAAIVGTAGEIEHGSALIHTPYFGNLVREFLEGSSILCFTDDRAEAGQSVVVPMWHKTHAATRSHYQSITTRVNDGPRADEIVVVVAGSTGPRPHSRIGDRATDPNVTSKTLQGDSA